MDDTAALLALFRRNFPTTVRSDTEALRALDLSVNHVLPVRDDHGALIGASVIRHGVILLLCVDAAHRR